MNEKEFRQLLEWYQEEKLDEINRRQVEMWYNSFGDSTKVEPLENPMKKKNIHKELLDNLSTHIRFTQEAETKSRRRYYQIAAAVLFFVIAGWLVREQKESDIHPKQLLSTQNFITYDTVQTDVGIEKKVLLPDSSEVWLNAGSRLRYSISSFNNNREVFLDYGEAFFEVKKNSESPFIVHTEDVISRVLGTSFNVKNYRTLDYTSIEVKTGKVQVSTENKRLIDTIPAGTGVRYSKEAGTFMTGDSFDAGSWREGRTLLVDATFNELAMVFYNRFRVNLKTNLPQAEAFRYTISIMQNKPLDETLKLICDIHQTNYRRNENEITIY